MNQAPKRVLVQRLRPVKNQANPGAGNSRNVQVDYQQASQMRAIHLSSLLRAQRRLSFGVAAVTLVMLFGLPAMLHWVPGLREVSIAGVGLMWVGLGLLIYPAMWGVGRFYVHHAHRIENEFRQAVDDLT